MKYTLLKLGKTRANPIEMIMGIPEAKIRDQYRIDQYGKMRIKHCCSKR